MSIIRYTFREKINSMLRSYKIQFVDKDWEESADDE